jgi:hypothetical protein
MGTFRIVSVDAKLYSVFVLRILHTQLRWDHTGDVTSGVLICGGTLGWGVTGRSPEEGVAEDPARGLERGGDFPLLILFILKIISQV